MKSTPTCDTDVMKYLDNLRDNKDFKSLKDIRDYLRYLINVNNKDWLPPLDD